MISSAHAIVLLAFFVGDCAADDQNLLRGGISSRSLAAEDLAVCDDFNRDSGTIGTAWWVEERGFLQIVDNAATLVEPFRAERYAYYHGSDVDTEDPRASVDVTLDWSAGSVGAGLVLGSYGSADALVLRAQYIGNDNGQSLNLVCLQAQRTFFYTYGLSYGIPSLDTGMNFGSDMTLEGAIDPNTGMVTFTVTSSDGLLSYTHDCGGVPFPDYQGLGGGTGIMMYRNDEASVVQIDNFANSGCTVPDPRCPKFQLINAKTDLVYDSDIQNGEEYYYLDIGSRGLSVVADFDEETTDSVAFTLNGEPLNVATKYPYSLDPTWAGIASDPLEPCAHLVPTP